MAPVEQDTMDGKRKVLMVVTVGGYTHAGKVSFMVPFSLLVVVTDSAPGPLQRPYWSWERFWREEAILSSLQPLKVRSIG